MTVLIAFQVFLSQANCSKRLHCPLYFEMKFLIALSSLKLPVECGRPALTFSFELLFAWGTAAPLAQASALQMALYTLLRLPFAVWLLAKYRRGGCFWDCHVFSAAIMAFGVEWRPACFWGLKYLAEPTATFSWCCWCWLSVFSAAAEFDRFSRWFRLFVVAPPWNLQLQRLAKLGAQDARVAVALGRWLSLNSMKKTLSPIQSTFFKWESDAGQF